MSDGGPAFPVADVAKTQSPGMTLRDWFAGQALAFWAHQRIGGWAGELSPEHADNVAVHAYIVADAMIRARSQGNTGETR